MHILVVDAHFDQRQRHLGGAGVVAEGNVGIVQHGAELTLVAEEIDREIGARFDGCRADDDAVVRFLGNRIGGGIEDPALVARARGRGGLFLVRSGRGRRGQGEGDAVFGGTGL